MWQRRSLIKPTTSQQHITAPYYIDVGASELVADGKIKLAQGQVVEVQPNGLKLENGTELSADAIIFATGFTSMNGWAASLISQDVANKVGKCWGLGSDTPKDLSLIHI